MLGTSPDSLGIATALELIKLLEESFMLKATGVLDAKKPLDKIALKLLEVVMLDTCEFTNDFEIELTIDDASETMDLLMYDEFTSIFMLDIVLEVKAARID